MNSLQPLTRKVNHIEGLRFHPSDTQSELFDVIVNEMKIFEGADENGEKCGYLYFLSDKSELYKMRTITKEEFTKRGDAFSKVQSSSGLLTIAKILHNDFSDIIPLFSKEQFQRKLIGSALFNYVYFKSRKTWFLQIQELVHKVLQLDGLDPDIADGIKRFISFKQDVIVPRGFGFDFHAKQDILRGTGRITQDDIEKGNDILKKVIDYLENVSGQQK